MMMSLQEIRDYSLSQTTLDDVFIHFASQQSEEQSLAGEEEEEEERREGHPGPLPDIVTHSRGVSVMNVGVSVLPQSSYTPCIKSLLPGS